MAQWSGDNPNWFIKKMLPSEGQNVVEGDTAKGNAEKALEKAAVKFAVPS